MNLKNEINTWKNFPSEREKRKAEILDNLTLLNINLYRFLDEQDIPAPVIKDALQCVDKIAVYIRTL